MRDKDGVSAAILVAELAADAQGARAAALTDLLDDIAREYGLHATDQLSARFEDLSVRSTPRWTGCARSRRPRSAGAR